MKTAAPVTSADRRTRDRVVRLLLDGGPQTAGQLGQTLGLTAAAIRRHLDAMLEDGTIVAREPRSYGPRGRGRPARVFALSDAGHAAMPNAYDDLAAAALGFLAESAGEEAVVAFARERAGDLERRYRDRVSPVRGESRPEALAAALSDAGYAATTARAGLGVQICQHHCPVQHVAEQFPELCEAETEAFGRLLGVHVQRLATIAHGDGVCTTHVPLSPPGAKPRSTRRARP